MADAALNIKIGADVQNALTGLKQVEAASIGLTSSVKKVQESFIVQNNTLNQSVGYMRQQEQKVKDLTNAEYDLARAAAAAKNAQGSDAFGGFIKGANEAYSSVRKLAYILPGIGIAGIFNLAFEAIGKAVEVFKGFNKETDKLKLNKDIISEAVGGQAGDIARVQALAAAVRDTTLSYAERKRALDLLKETNKAYFGDLTLEKSSLETLTQKVTDYSNALIRAAVVKGFTDEITKTTIEFNKQKDVLDDLKLKYDNAQKAQEAFKPVPIQAGGRGGGNVTSRAITDNLQLIATTNLAKEAFENQRVVVENLQTAIANYTGKIQDAVAAELKIPLLKDLPKVKIKPEVEDVGPLHEALRLGTFLNTDNFDQNIKTVQRKLDKHPMRIDLTIGFNELDAIKRATALGKQVSNILSYGIGSAIENVSEAIGNALGSGGNVLKSAGAALLASIGALLKDLGQSLVEFAAIKIVIDKIGITNPYVELAVGAAAIVAGSALQAKANGAHAFAEGGIVTGPTMGLVGEAGPEVIFPLDKLNRFIKGNNGQSNRNINVTGEISGQNLRLVLARANNNQSYV